MATRSRTAADNALHRLLPLLAELVTHHWDDGDAEFPPTALQVSSPQAGTGAENVIPAWPRPGSICASIRCRRLPSCSTRSSHAAVRMRSITSLDWHVSGQPFVTREGAMLDATMATVAEVFAITPALSTAGGTSGGRFIAPAGAQVVEFGVRNNTIHQANERVAVAAIGQVSRCIEHIVERLLPA
ncbi:MAG TPA: M20/M25/M40 family metallo-hydrolase [Salinisphaeraceae bacterium]|nr:M20/M25/M40 family metallo-hydrolase [Salinisphaeraceae bacterium]